MFKENIQTKLQKPRNNQHQTNINKQYINEHFNIGRIKNHTLTNYTI